MLRRMIIAAAISVATTGAMAADGHWEQVDQQSNSASNPRDIKALFSLGTRQANVRDWLAKEFVTDALVGLRPSPVVSISMTVTSYKYVDGSCTADDPRGMYTADSGSVNYRNGAAMGWASSMPSPDWDPCADDGTTFEAKRIVVSTITIIDGNVITLNDWMFMAAA